MLPSPTSRGPWSHQVNMDSGHGLQMHMPTSSYGSHVPSSRPPPVSQQPLPYHAPPGPSFPGSSYPHHSSTLASVTLNSQQESHDQSHYRHDIRSSHAPRGTLSSTKARAQPRRESPEVKPRPSSPSGSGRDSLASALPDVPKGRLVNLLVKKMEESDQVVKDTTETVKQQPPTQYTANGKIKRFACKFSGCGHTCAQQGQLETHMRKHTGIKPYKCRFCDFRASQRGNLKGHENKHTGARPFSCPARGCDKTFFTAGNLHNHSKTHYPQLCHCPLQNCRKSYTNTNNLKTHMENKHSEPIAELIIKINDGKPLNEEEKKLSAHLFKNHQTLNRGIKGRGQGVKVERLAYAVDESAPKVPASPHRPSQQQSLSPPSSYTISPPSEMQFYHGHPQQLPSVSMFHSHGYPPQYLGNTSHQHQHQHQQQHQQQQQQQHQQQQQQHGYHQYPPTSRNPYVEMAGPSSMCFETLPAIPSSIPHHAMPVTQGQTSSVSSPANSFSSREGGYSDVGTPESDFAYVPRS